MNEIKKTDKITCANCAHDRRKDLRGICENCFELWRKGTIVKILDTMDKDRWSCGCYMRPENFYPCSNHTEEDNPCDTWFRSLQK